MFLSPTRPRSIASQLVFLFTLAAAFLLACGLVAFYLIVVRHGVEEDNEFLPDRLSALRGELSQTGGLGSLTSTLRNPHASKVEAYWVRVISSKGDVVTETPKMGVFLPPSAFPDPQDKNSVYRPKNYRISKKLFSLVAAIEEADGQPYIIQLAQDRSSDEQFATQFAFVLGGALGLGILASAMIAIAVTKRGLRPLQQMTHSLERIGPTHLDERVGKTTWPRELQPVATAFDAMLARPAIEKIAAYYRTIAEERGISITNKGDGEVYADALLFDRALSNLLDNALRFTPDGGKITIATETKPDRTELALEDTGCGIPPQHLAHVCDRFYRVDSSRSSKGTGLGLALVKSITDLHAGSVAVASKVDRGTTVTLTFPGEKGRMIFWGAPIRE